MQSNPTFTADNRLVQRLQSSLCPYRVHAAARTSPIRNPRDCWACQHRFSPKTAPSPLGIVTPRTLFLGPRPTHHPNSISIRSVQPFCMGPKCYAIQCTVNGEEYPQTAPFPWNFVTLSEEDRAKARGNMHKTFGIERTCGLRGILQDRQTHTHTDVPITILHKCLHRR